MPTIFTHTVASLVAGKAFTNKKMPLRFWILSISCSIFPDLDVLAFRLDIPYDSFWGHRGFLHSPAFALFLGFFTSTLFFSKVKRGSKNWWALSLYFFLLTASHGLLDGLTDGGEGIAFFSPFDDSRYFFPFQPILVSPIGIRSFLTSGGLRVMVNEVLWVWIPALVLLMAVIRWRAGQSKTAPPPFPGSNQKL